MSRYRYFELTGDSLAFFLNIEKREMEFRESVREKLKAKGITKSCNDPATGEPMAFAAEKCPEGCRAFKWSGHAYHGFYEPYKGTRGGEWRRFLDSLKMPDDLKTQDLIRNRLDVPRWVVTDEPGARSGALMLDSVVGHAGDKVFVKIPSAAADFETHPDLREVKEWEFMKCKEEAQENEQPRYTL